MTPLSAITFLTEYTKPRTTQERQPKDRIKVFLKDYCFYYISKNLPSIIRQQKLQLAKLDVMLQY